MTERPENEEENVVRPFNEPERELHRRLREQQEREERERAALEAARLERERQEAAERIRIQMAANIANMSLEEYASRIREDVGPALVVPQIPQERTFELKAQFLHMLKDLQFNGNDDEDAHEHVDSVLEIASYFHTPGITQDVVMLRAFPITLKGQAKRWLRNEPTATIQTWDALKSRFIKQFTPPSKIARLKSQIQNFAQSDEESLYETWERYKEMLQRCPQHDLNGHQIVQIFYNGINVCTRQMVDSQGPIPKKTPAEGYNTIEEMARHSHQWHSMRDPSFRKKTQSSEGNDGLAALNAKLDSLGRDIKKVNVTIHAMKVGCDNCGGPHLAKDCNLDEHGNTKAEACVSTGDYLDNNWKPKPRNPNWKPYHEYKKDQEAKYKQSAPGFYQRDQREGPREPERKMSFEEMLTRFAEASEQRHKDTEELVTRIGNSTEAALKHQQASINAIQNQVGQIAQTLKDRFPMQGQFSTGPKPQADMKAANQAGKYLGSLFHEMTHEFAFSAQVQDTVVES